jgi:hypothetical protein
VVVGIDEFLAGDGEEEREELVDFELDWWRSCVMVKQLDETKLVVLLNGCGLDGDGHATVRLLPCRPVVEKKKGKGGRTIGVRREKGEARVSRGGFKEGEGAGGGRTTAPSRQVRAHSRHCQG